MWRNRCARKTKINTVCLRSGSQAENWKLSRGETNPTLKNRYLVHLERKYQCQKVVMWKNSDTPLNFSARNVHILIQIQMLFIYKALFIPAQHKVLNIKQSLKQQQKRTRGQLNYSSLPLTEPWSLSLFSLAQRQHRQRPSCWPSCFS